MNIYPLAAKPAQSISSQTARLVFSFFFIYSIFYFLLSNKQRLTTKN